MPLTRSENKATTNLHALPPKSLMLVLCIMIPVMRIPVMEAWLWIKFINGAACTR
jgi:hypothetical protein